MMRPSTPLWCHHWFRVLEPPAADVSSWFSACYFCTPYFLPVSQTCVCQTASSSCCPDASPQWPTSWSSLRTGRLESILSGLVFSQRCWVHLCMFMETAGTWYFCKEELRIWSCPSWFWWKMISNVIFNGEISTGKGCCSFMCWVAVQVCQQTLCIWTFCCWSWTPRCSDHCFVALPAVCPTITSVGCLLHNSMKGRINLPQFSVSECVAWWLCFLGHSWNWR